MLLHCVFIERSVIDVMFQNYEDMIATFGDIVPGVQKIQCRVIGLPMIPTSTYNCLCLEAVAVLVVSLQ